MQKDLCLRIDGRIHRRHESIVNVQLALSNRYSWPPRIFDESA
jgi:hypothetical protein